MVVSAGVAFPPLNGGLRVPRQRGQFAERRTPLEVRREDHSTFPLLRRFTCTHRRENRLPIGGGHSSAGSHAARVAGAPPGQYTDRPHTSGQVQSESSSMCTAPTGRAVTGFVVMMLMIGRGFRVRN